MGLLWDRQFGFLRETLVAPVRDSKSCWDGTLGAATVRICQGFLVMVICFIAGFRFINLSSFPLALLFMLLIAALFSAMGTTIGSVLQNMQGFQFNHGIPGDADLLSLRGIVSIAESTVRLEHRDQARSSRLRRRRNETALTGVSHFACSRRFDLDYGSNCVTVGVYAFLFEDRGLRLARSRSASAHKKVLRAVLELVAERGIDATSMDAVAAKSGVSKATIYKHWADKDALLLEMLAEANGLLERPNFDTGHTRRDMVRYWRIATGRRRLARPHAASLCRLSATKREFGMAWRNMSMSRRAKN